MVPFGGACPHCERGGKPMDDNLIMALLLILLILMTIKK